MGFRRYIELLLEGNPLAWSVTAVGVALAILSGGKGFISAILKPRRLRRRVAAAKLMAAIEAACAGGQVDDERARIIEDILRGDSGPPIRAQDIKRHAATMPRSESLSQRIVDLTCELDPEQKRQVLAVAVGVAVRTGGINQDKREVLAHVAYGMGLTASAVDELLSSKLP